MAGPMDWTHIRPWTQLFRYPHDDAAGVVFTRADYECFLPEAPLNRTAVDFGLRVIARHVDSDPSNIARDVHTFPSDFFTMLRGDDSFNNLKADGDMARRAYARVERWTRGVDVFAKKFLLVPVFEDQHWSLAIICHPGLLARRALARRRYKIRRAVADLVDAGITEATRLAEPHVEDDDSESDSDSDWEYRARPCVIHMDSLRKHSAKKIEKWLRFFLEMEWRKRHADEPPFTCLERSPDGPAADLLLAMPRVPQQQMYSGDSGIYMLKYAQEFLARAVCGGAELKVNRRDVALCFRGHDLVNWFDGNDIKGMRLRHKDLVRVLQSEEEHRQFRARRRLCWIGQRDPGSPLSRLPLEILRKLVPYFSLPDFYV